MNDLETTKQALDSKGVQYVVREHQERHCRKPVTAYTLEHGNTVYVFDHAKRLVFHTFHADHHRVDRPEE